MRTRKVYGESKIEKCIICGKHALSLNTQGFPVCNAHKSSIMPELKCLCGEYLMMMDGKFGKFFQCIKCGNINMKRAIEVNEELIQKANNNKNITNNKDNNNNHTNNKDNNNNHTNNKDHKQEYNDHNQRASESTAAYIREEKNPADKIIRSDDPDYFD